MIERVSTQVQLDWNKRRRDTMRAAGRCINDSKAGTHGPVVPRSGGRCQHCLDVKNRGRNQTPMTVPCPQCFAKKRQPCVSSLGVPTRAHQARSEAAAAQKQEVA